MEDLLALALRLGVITILGAIALWLCVVAALWLLQRHLLYMAPDNPPGALTQAKGGEKVFQSVVHEDDIGLFQGGV